MRPSKLILVALLLGLTGCRVNASNSDTVSTASTVSTDATETVAAVNASTAPDVTPYAEVLSRYVDGQNLIDYDGLQGDRQSLDRYNAALAAATPASYDNWSEAEQIAFWVNAYNSLTLASIINQAPVKASIKDIPGVWKVKKHPVLSQSKTLDNIEHKTLRVDFNEPRIHAALVCAALSCPPLRNEPYTADQLDAQLDDQVRQWLASPTTGLRIDRAAGEVHLSSIFKWFGEDWVPTYGVENGFTGGDKQRAVLNFVSNYVSPEDKAYLEAGDYKVKYLKYDWSLNRQAS